MIELLKQQCANRLSEVREARERLRDSLDMADRLWWDKELTTRLSFYRRASERLDWAQKIKM